MDTYKYLLPEINGLIDAYCKTKLEYLDELIKGCTSMKFRRCNYCEGVILYISAHKHHMIEGGFVTHSSTIDMCYECCGPTIRERSFMIS